MDHTYITINKEFHTEKIIILSMNRFDKLNAINNTFITELNTTLDWLLDQSNIRVLIIHSKLLKAFCAGIDVTYVLGLSNEEAANFFEEIAKVLERIIDLPHLTIGAVNGYAYGAGADLALACDVRIGGVTSSYRFPGPQFGLILGTRRLINELGPSRSRYLTMTNERLNANKALQFGLLHEVVQDDQVLEYALNKAKTLVQVPKYAVEMIKKLTNNNELDSEPVQMTTESVLASNFQHRFTNYINKNE